MSESKLRGAFIGFGNIAELGHLPAYRELDVEIVASVDICEKRRARSEEEGVRSYSKIEELKSYDLDFIDICTPPSYRLEPTKFAAENGFDVICEKPISHPDELDKIKELVLETGVFFFPIHNWKYSPQYLTAIQLGRENGGVESLQMDTLRTHYGTGNPDWNPDWRVDKKISGGGVIMDHGYHNIYLAMELFEGQFTDAKLEGIEYFDDHPGVEKKAKFTLQFPNNRNARISLDWEAGKREIKNTIFECTHKIELSDNSIVDNNQTYEFDESLSGDSVHGTWFKAVFKDFLRLRGANDNSCFLDASRVLDSINSLYKQAEVF